MLPDSEGKARMSDHMTTGDTPGHDTPGHVPDILTLQEAATYLRVHYETMRRWCRDGVLPSTQIGSIRRVRRDDLDRLWTRTAQANEANDGDKTDKTNKRATGVAGGGQ